MDLLRGGLDLGDGQPSSAMNVCTLAGTIPGLVIAVTVSQKATIAERPPTCSTACATIQATEAITSVAHVTDP